jgi:hypothetical protein
MIWTPQVIRDTAASAKDPEYFVDTFGWMNADEGIVQFNMGHSPAESYYYQREILRELIAGSNIVILKNRRAGLSWIAAAICAWGINFNRGWDALLISRTEKEAVSLLKKVKFILANLRYKDNPDITQATRADWLCNNIEINNQHTLSIGHQDNRGIVTAYSSVNSLTTTKHSGRGEKSRFVFVDEVQFIENQDEVFGSALITAARSGQWMMGSNAGDVGTRFHHLCMKGRAKENETYWYREVRPNESGIDESVIASARETMPDDIVNQEWYLEFRQSGDAVFNATHLAACFKPPDLYPEIAETLDQYREKVKYGKGEFYYYSGVDNAVGKVHRKSREKDYNAWTSLTMSGIQAFTYVDKKPLSTWAGQNVKDNEGRMIASPGKVSSLHAQWPGLALIEEEGPGYTVINRHVIPSDGISDFKTISMKHHLKSRIIKNLIIAIESHSIVITDEKTYQQLSMYQFGDKPDTYEAPLGFNDDLVIALALALEGLRIEGGVELVFARGSDLEGLEMQPFDKAHDELITYQNAMIMPAVMDQMPVGARPSFYLPNPFNDIPEPSDPRWLPDPRILRELNNG